MVQLLPALHSRASICGRHVHDCNIYSGAEPGPAMTLCPEGGCPRGLHKTKASDACSRSWKVTQLAAVEVTTALQGPHMAQESPPGCPLCVSHVHINRLPQCRHCGIQ